MASSVSSSSRAETFRSKIPSLRCFQEEKFTLDIGAGKRREAEGLKELGWRF